MRDEDTKSCSNLTSSVAHKPRHLHTEACKKSVFKVHYNLLVLHSDVFRTMLSVPMKEATERALEFKDVKPETVERVLEYIYTGEYWIPPPEPVKPTTGCVPKVAGKRSCIKGYKGLFKEEMELSELDPASLHKALQVAGPPVIVVAAPTPPEGSQDESDLQESPPSVRSARVDFSIHSATAAHSRAPRSFRCAGARIAGDSPSNPPLSLRAQHPTSTVRLGEMRRCKYHSGMFAWDEHCDYRSIIKLHNLHVDAIGGHRASSSLSHSYFKQLIAHAKVYVFAHAYNISGLENLSYSRIKAILQKYDLNLIPQFIN